MQIMQKQRCFFLSGQFPQSGKNKRMKGRKTVENKPVAVYGSFPAVNDGGSFMHGMGKMQDRPGNMLRQQLLDGCGILRKHVDVGVNENFDRKGRF